MAQNPYEEYLNDIAHLITIRDEDRPVYTKDFEIIKDHVLNGMKKVDSVFKKLYHGTSLFGSYSNNVRIKYPNEFDVIFILSLPHSYQTVVSRDPIRPGYVHVDLENVLEHLSKLNGYSDVVDRFEELVNDDDYLMRTKLQTWLADVMETCLQTYGYQVRGSDGDLYTLVYSERGLAHTIYAKSITRSKPHSISIDLIPGFCFGCTDWMKINRRCKFWYNSDQWYAVPKPPGDREKSNCFTFMVCNPRVERKLLLGKQNLKVVFRLLKSLRNALKMKRLKSYFITTAFLWEIERQNEAFWHNPLHLLLEHMLECLATAFADGCLRFYWDRENNILDILDDNEIEKYAEKLQRAYQTLRSYKHQPNLTYNKCLTHFEIP